MLVIAQRSAWLRPVEAALDTAAAPVDVFLRDDDTGWGDDALLALLDLVDAHELPIDLAVIPGALGVRLATALRLRAAAGDGRLRLHQHGYAHVDHETEGRKCEFGPARDRESQRADIQAGRRRLLDRLGEAIDPIFTPPWNRCTRDTAVCLAELGFAALSRETRAEPYGLPGLAELPISVDWFAHRHRVRLTPRELGVVLGGAVISGAPVGLMLHHAIMDAADRRRAGELFALLAEHENARPVNMASLVSRRLEPA
jgi:hypothetical protein